MRFTFLGTGTSAGIPMIGCACEVCRSDDPRDRRLRTAACVRFRDATGRDRVVLIDAGPDLRAQAIGAGLERCDGIVFTHNHVDHIFGLDEVRRFNAVQRGAIEIHADDHTMDALERVYKHIFERENNVNDSFVATLIPRRISATQIAGAQPIDISGMLFTPIPLLHGRLPILGWRIEPGDELARVWAASNSPDDADDAEDVARSPFPLAYCTDVSSIPPESWARLVGLRTLVLDCLREKAHPTHLTLRDAVSIAERVNAMRTYFVHMTHDLPHQATQARLPERMFLAWDGLTLRG